MKISARIKKIEKNFEDSESLVNFATALAPKGNRNNF